MSKPEYRKAERTAHCRVCNKTLNKGDYAIFWWSMWNRGMNIIICPMCISDLNDMLPEDESEVYL